MKKILFNVYTYKILVIFLLVFSLYFSMNYNSLNISDYINNKVYAAQSKEAQSSVSTNTEATGTEMVELLARLINGEARGEPYQGQVAVGAVILNRVKSTNFPNTIAGVIYQKGQFSCVTDGQFDVAISEGSTVHKAAEEAMNGADPTNGALYFYNPSKTKSKWLFSLKTTTTIGKHVFASGEK